MNEINIKMETKIVESKSIKTIKCICCGREKELRFGVCFDCANAESIIVEGADMWDEKVKPIEGLSEGLSKVHHILNLYGVIVKK